MSTQKAVNVAKDSVDVVDRPIPVPEAGEVLIKSECMQLAPHASPSLAS